jgi:hypothetical protein
MQKAIAGLVVPARAPATGEPIICPTVSEHLAALAKEVGFDEPDALAERLLFLLEGAAMAAMRHSGEPLEEAGQTGISSWKRSLLGSAEQAQRPLAVGLLC